jgi:Flp pilus assembly protein TadD
MGPRIDIDTALREAMAHHQAGRLDQAAALYARVLEAAPDHPDALNLAGVAAAQAGAFVQAESLIRRAVALAPGIAQFHNNLGIALKNQGRTIDAIASFEKAVALDARNAEALCNLGAVLYVRGAADSAAARLEAALVAAPNAPMPHALLAGLLFNRGELADAERHLRRAAALSPHYEYGAACFLDADYAELADEAAFADRLAALPPITGEMPARDGGGFIIYAGCDARYFHDYARAIPLSAAAASPGIDVHLHVVTPDAGFGAAITRLKSALQTGRLTVSTEHAPQSTRADLANMRFARAAALLDAVRRPILMLDADSLVRGDVSGLAAMFAADDLALFARPDNLPLNQQVLTSAMFVRPTEHGVRFMRRLGAYIMGCAARDLRPWYLDQCGVTIILKRTQMAGEPLRVAQLPQAYVDHALGDGARIWTGKGGGKDGDKFRAALAAVLAQGAA